MGKRIILIVMLMFLSLEPMLMAQQGTQSESYKSYIEASVNSIIDNGFAVGGSVVLGMNGAYVYKGSFGYLEKGKDIGFSSDAIFYTGRLFELVARGAIASLSSRGNISLDFDYREYLETRATIRSMQNSIRVIDLINHVSGLEGNDLFLDSMMDLSLQEYIKDFPINTYIPPRQTVVKNDYDTLALMGIVERKSGVGFSQYLKEIYFEQHNLLSSHVADQNPNYSSAVIVYDLKGKRVSFDSESFNSRYALFCSVEDLHSLWKGIKDGEDYSPLFSREEYPIAGNRRIKGGLIYERLAEDIEVMYYASASPGSSLIMGGIVGEDFDLVMIFNQEMPERILVDLLHGLVRFHKDLPDTSTYAKEERPTDVVEGYYSRAGILSSESSYIKSLSPMTKLKVSDKGIVLDRTLYIRSAEDLSKFISADGRAIFYKVFNGQPFLYNEDKLLSPYALYNNRLTPSITTKIFFGYIALTLLVVAYYVLDYLLDVKRSNLWKNSRALFILSFIIVICSGVIIALGLNPSYSRALTFGGVRVALVLNILILVLGGLVIYNSIRRRLVAFGYGALYSIYIAYSLYCTYLLKFWNII